MPYAARTLTPPSPSLRIASVSPALAGELAPELGALPRPIVQREREVLDAMHLGLHDTDPFLAARGLRCAAEADLRAVPRGRQAKPASSVMPASSVAAMTRRL